jgi:hypothetical protein
MNFRRRKENRNKVDRTAWINVGDGRPLRNCTLAEWEIRKRLSNVLEKYRDRMGLAHAAAPQNPASWADGLVLDAETLNYYKATDWAHLGDGDMIVPIRLKALVEEQEVDDQILQLAEKRVKEQERDEYEALEAAILDLIRLGRYERRAWSRQKRAIREFMKIKMTGVGFVPRRSPRSVSCEICPASVGRTDPSEEGPPKLAERSQKSGPS